MIKLYDDQKLEIVKQFKDLYNNSIEYIKGLKDRRETEDWISVIDLNEYDSINEKMGELINDLNKDLHSLNEKQWNMLLCGLTINNLCEENNENEYFEIKNQETANMLNHLSFQKTYGFLMAISLFGGNSNKKNFD